MLGLTAANHLLAIQRDANRMRLRKTLILTFTTLFLGINILIEEAIASESANWDKTIKKVTDSVVSIRVNAVRAFDTEGNNVTQATGFVVDAKRGIILTNRHVVHPGPITAEAIFSNSEEVELIPIYRDPVHDFGFFKYDPAALEFIKPTSLKLVDNKAKIGDDVKVIGNDSGEHMSILSGTLARLDRPAPTYRRGGYNDFNTFYFQSAADTSGGSSGSPVVNVHGEVIALNAGGSNRSSSSFFLPLFKITKALRAIQSGKLVERGTLGTTFDYQPYDQAKRLGLTAKLENQFRQKSQGDGLLIVQHALKGSEAFEKLRPGDILVSLQSQKTSLELVSRYEVLEIFLDQHVGEEITVKVLRQGQLLSQSLRVTDLHSITPDKYLEIGGAVLNNLSYQIARQVNMPAEGVYIAASGHIFSNAGLNRGTVIQAVNGIPTKDLKDLIDALKQLKQNEYFQIEYVNIGNPVNKQIASAKFQTNWHLSTACQRDDQTGVWPCKSVQWSQEFAEIDPTEVKFSQHKNKRVDQVSRSLVMVQSNLPYFVDGQAFPSYSGTGLVVDAENGLVVTDRNTVPIKMAQVSLTFAGVAEVPAEILFIHPLHSFALLKYDTKLLKDSEIRSARIDETPLESGDTAWLVGYQTANRLISEAITVSAFDPLTLPVPGTPQFRDININAISVNNPPAVASGVLLDKRGKVRSWWTNYAFGRSNQTIDRGLPIRHIKSLKDQWLKNGKISLYSLEAEFNPISLASAKRLGLNEDWIQKIQSESDVPQVLKISKVFAGSDSKNKLQTGDLLLSIDETVVNDFATLDRKVNQPLVKVSVWRNKAQIDLEVSTKTMSQTDTLEAYIWAGALLQKPHRALATQRDIENKGVYVSWYWYGSPANRHMLHPLNRIVELEGEPVESMQQFITLTQKHKRKPYLRIRLIDLIGRESIITLKQDLHYWPTQRVHWDGEKWINELIE